MIHCSESQAGESSRTLSFFIFINVCSLSSNSERDNCWNEEAEVSEIQVTADGIIDATMVEGGRHWVPEMDAIIFTVEAVDTCGDATPQVFLY